MIRNPERDTTAYHCKNNMIQESDAIQQLLIDNRESFRRLVVDRNTTDAPTKSVTLYNVVAHKNFSISFYYCTILEKCNDGGGRLCVACD